MKKITLLFIFFAAFSLSLTAQNSIISREEADELFGPPIQSISFHAKVLESLLDTHEYIMFRIKDDKVNIFGRNRAPILQQFPSDENDVYYVFEAKTLIELLELGGEEESYIELRAGGEGLTKDTKITDGDETVTVSNGDVALWPPFVCPPFCG
jgi:hypothetical protein